MSGGQQSGGGAAQSAQGDIGRVRGSARRGGCKTFCCRRDALALAIGAAAAALGSPPALAAQATTVTVGGHTGHFSPPEVKICRGDSVTWVTAGGGPEAASALPHSIVFVDGVGPGAAADVGQTPIAPHHHVNSGQQLTRTFGAAGTYQYYCQNHLYHGELGRVVVMD